MSPGHRRREAALRGSQCQRAAIAHGLHATLAVLIVLADYAAMSGDLPYPSQRKLAERTRRTVRAVQYQLGDLERAGIIIVRRSRPRRGTGGRFTRSTNRYVLCDARARRELQNPRSHLGATDCTSSVRKKPRPAARGPARAEAVTVVCPGPAPPTRTVALLRAEDPPLDAHTNAGGLGAARAALIGART